MHAYIINFLKFTILIEIRGHSADYIINFVY